MAKKKSANKVNKSELIRAYIAEFPDKSPKEVAEFITAQGYPVSPQFVSTTKSNAKKAAGKKPGKRGPKANSDKGISAFRGKATIPADLGNALEAVIAANTLLKAAGSVENAKLIIDRLGGGIVDNG